ncbi:glycosyltransferase [Patescibacteria group bacterium]|nr:glycosyltransferase [Patescibacteria group bacterium]
MSNSQSAAPLSTVIIAYSWSHRVVEFADQFPVFVIENNPAAKAKDRQKNISLIHAPINTGFSKAANEGWHQAQTKYLLFLNDDCLITQEQIQLLLAEAETKQLDALSPRLVDQDGKSQESYQQALPTFTELVVSWSPLHRFFGLPKTELTLPGACLLIRRDVLTDLGGWDERFWLWWEDADLSYRLKQAGYSFAISESVRVKHLGAESFAPLETDWKKQVFFHSLRLFAHKHFSSWQSAIIEKLTGRFDRHLLYPVDPDVRASVVVPNVRKELLSSFLEHHASNWNREKDELIVVTSARGSQDLQAKYPWVVWIQLEHNRGFADTVNIGLRRARGQWLGTVNDDVILPKDWLKKLIKAAEPKAGSLSPVVCRPTGEIESVGVNYQIRGKAEPITTIPDKITSADTINAAAVLFKHEALEEVGLFDDRFGSYLEDVDLGLRLRRAGWENQVIPEVQVTHLGHQTSSSRPLYTYWLNVKNWWLLLLKNYSLKQWLSNLGPILLERGRNISGLLKTAARSL